MMVINKWIKRRKIGIKEMLKYRIKIKTINNQLINTLSEVYMEDELYLILLTNYLLLENHL